MEQITSLREKFRKTSNDNNGCNQAIPQQFICPLTKCIMADPVMAFDRLTYEREAIEKYLLENGKSPVTGEDAYTMNVYSHRQLKQEIQEYCLSSGVEGVHTAASTSDGTNDAVDTV